MIVEIDPAIFYDLDKCVDFTIKYMAMAQNWCRKSVTL